MGGASGLTGPLPSTGTPDPLAAIGLRAGEWAPSLILQPLGILGRGVDRGLGGSSPDSRGAVAAPCPADPYRGSGPVRHRARRNPPRTDQFQGVVGPAAVGDRAGRGTAQCQWLWRHRLRGADRAGQRSAHQTRTPGHRPVGVWPTLPQLLPYSVVVFVPLLAAYAGGLGTRIGVAASAAVATATWVGTVLLAEAMRRRHYPGPAEKILRRLTNGRGMAFRTREPEPGTDGSGPSRHRPHGRNLTRPATDDDPDGRLPRTGRHVMRRRLRSRLLTQPNHIHTIRTEAGSPPFGRSPAGVTPESSGDQHRRLAGGP